MMRRKWFVVICLLVVFAASVFLGWLGATNSGARFVVRNIVRYIPGTIDIGDVRGTLAGDLRIVNLSFHSADWEMSAEQIRLRWKPLSLVGGWLQISKLYLENITVNDLHPEIHGSYDLTWPEVPTFLSWIKARVRSLAVSGITYREKGQEVFFAHQFSSQLTWYLGTLNVSNLEIVSPEGLVDGILGANFASPRLSANMRLFPERIAYGLNEFHIALQMKGARKRYMEGGVTVIGMAGDSEQIKFAASVSTRKEGVVLDQVELREMGRAGGLKGRVSVDVSQATWPFELDLALSEVAVSKEKGSMGAVSGNLWVRGDRNGYQGRLRAESKDLPWGGIIADCPLEGDFGGLRLRGLAVRLFKGTINGGATVSWMDGLRVSWLLEGRGLDPGTVVPEWPGRINGKVSGILDWSHADGLEGSIQLHLRESRVRNRELYGSVDAQWTKGLLKELDGQLRGKGFDLSARGTLTERLDCRAAVTDLGGIIPGAKGRFAATGWTRRGKDGWVGAVKGEGTSLAIADFSVGSFSIDAQVGERETDSVRGKLQVRQGMKGELDLGSQVLSVEGKVQNHEIQGSQSWMKVGATFIARGSYRDGQWRGTVTTLEGKDSESGDFKALKPVDITISPAKVAMTPLILMGNNGEAAELGGELALNPLQGTISARWENINLARANAVLTQGRVQGGCTGSVTAQLMEDSRVKLHGSSSAKLRYQSDRLTIESSSTVTVHGDEAGWRVVAQGDFNGVGRIETQFLSNEAARLKVPERGILKLTWRDIDVSTVSPWLPRAVNVRGTVAGSIQGRLEPGHRFGLSGSARVSGASLAWRGSGGLVRSRVDRANFDFEWKDEGLTGDIDLHFAGNGMVRGRFSLPIPGRFPVTPEEGGSIDVAAKGEISEMGMVNVLFPGVVEETAGRLMFDVAQRGTWQNPKMEGRVSLQDASAYLPTTGARVRDISARVSLSERTIQIESFSARSGPGRLTGSGFFAIKDWAVEALKVEIKGERFQVLGLSELELLVNPELTVEKRGETIFVRGTVVLPEGKARDRQDREVIQASEDVVVVDRPAKPSGPGRIPVDVEVSVIFGEKVRLDMEGLEGRLAGKVVLTGQSAQQIYGKGIVRIVDGRFAGYGLKLDVTRGNIVLDGGPVEKASVDIMATKTFNPGSFDQVRAGVVVTGTARQPVIKLYSEPSMSDSDILSYLLFGRPLRAGGDAGQTALLLKTAGVLFGKSGGADLQSQIQQRLGLDTLDVTEGPSSTYASSRATNGGLERSLVTVGKYLHPRLYVSFGRSVFSDEYLVSARYSLGRRTEIETRTGTQSSVDLYYKVEFF